MPYTFIKIILLIFNSENKQFFEILFFRMTNNFPVGKPVYLYGKDVEKSITWDNQNISYLGESAEGLVQLSILCPKNMRIPFLQIRNKAKKSIAPSCYTCGFKSLKTSQINSCQHSDQQRAIVGTYCLSEIRYALKIGYQIQKIFSLLLYPKVEPLFRNYVAILGYEKIKASGLPSNVEDKDLYCKELNSKMNLENIGLSLSPDCITFDQQKRDFFKSALNSFLGKFSQKCDKPLHKIVSSEEEISDYFYGKTFEITDIFALNKFFCQLEVKKKRLTLCKPNRRTNCVIGSHVVAYARQFMHEKMIEINLAGGRLFYSDCDSLIFSLKKNQTMPLKISPAFGDFKYEIDPKFTIKSFYTLGPKNFAMQYADLEGNYRNSVRLRGVTLSNVFNETLIDTKIYEFYLQQSMKQKRTNVSIPQVRFRSSKFTKNKSFYFQKVFFSNSVHAKGIVDKQCPNYTIYPFGYSNV